MLMYAKTLLGLFCSKVIININCPIMGTNVNGCKTANGLVNSFDSTSASASKRKELLLPLHSKYPKSDVTNKRKCSSLVFILNTLFSFLQTLVLSFKSNKIIQIMNDIRKILSCSDIII